MALLRPALTALLCLAAAPVLAPALAPAAWAQAPEQARIVAVVNDGVVSAGDLGARLRLVQATTRLPDRPEARQRLINQVLRGLIDEQLQLQEAKRLNISVSDAEIRRQLAQLAQDNNIPADQFEATLQGSGIPPETLRSQIRAQLAWVRVIQRRIRPNVIVGDDEIDGVLERIRANIGKPEFRVQEIFLPVDDPTQEEQTQQLAQSLVTELRAGADFAALARQFSGSGATAGEIGWVQQGQLAEELETAVQALQPGQFSEPVRSVSGYHVMLLRDRRTVSANDPAQTEVVLKQLAFPVDPAAGEAGRAAARAQAAEAAPTIDGCAALPERAAALGNAEATDLPYTRLGELPPQLAQVLANQPIGKASPPVDADNAVALIVVCERKDTGSSLPSRDQIANALMQEKLELASRRYMRDLRRDAFIDVRG
ncbi:MAG TPA: peptidylprolyl isomerase [Alphaproteobacteria bacterium]|nr:peptidylprolyl isomerase [Alphaproteobacteria bacterium]